MVGVALSRYPAWKFANYVSGQLITSKMNVGLILFYTGYTHVGL